MTGEVIKSFLVGLGFDVDESSLTKFNKAILIATAEVTGLYAAVAATATGIGYGISKISEDFEQLGYEYRLIYPAINKAILLRQALFQAYSAAGVNLQKTVISAFRLNLSLTKTKLVLEALYKSTAARFFPLLTKQSDLFRQKIYANMPKIQSLLETFIRIVFKALEVLTTLGIRIWEALTVLWGVLKRVDDATGGWLFTILKIVGAWKLLNSVFLATPFGRLLALIGALVLLFDDYKGFTEGKPSLIDWNTFIPAINAAKDAFRGFLRYVKSTYETLKNFKWAEVFQDFLSGKISDAVDAIASSFGDAAKNAHSFFEALAGILKLIEELLKFHPVYLLGKLFPGIKEQLGGEPKIPEINATGARYPAQPVEPGLLDDINSTLKFISGGRIAPNAANLLPNIENAPKGVPPVIPLGSHTDNSNQTNQNVNQQTNINVIGSPDAALTGKSIASEQTKVNFDLVRNLQGAVLA